MSCFKIYDSLCDDLANMIRNFWWEKKGGKKDGVVKLGEDVCALMVWRVGIQTPKTI